MMSMLLSPLSLSTLLNISFMVSLPIVAHITASVIPRGTWLHKAEPSEPSTLFLRYSLYIDNLSFARR